MNKKLREVDQRYNHIVFFIVVLMLLLAVRLFILTMVQHDHWIEEASHQTTKTIYTPAPRGNIYDRNGILLAGNHQIFTATFNASNMKTDAINDAILTAVRKLEENGDPVLDDFPIKQDATGAFYYTFDKELLSWLSEHGFGSDASAEEVFTSVKAEYGVDTKDRYEAMETLENKHKIWLPINVRTMRYTYIQQKEGFLRKFGFKESEIKAGITASECVEDLRKVYTIDPGLPVEDVLKILTVRNKIADNSSQRYIPIKISGKLSDASVIYLEENGIPGLSVVSETERYYPYGNHACHYIGYLGAISDTETDTYTREKGYMPGDFVGKSGIEQAMETQLHGKTGYKTIVVNSSGEYVKTLEDEQPKKGRDVYLTCDINMQIMAEKALKETIDDIDTCRSGAMVALDVKNANVIASASYPDFDLNMMADGISTEEWASVQAENPRDAFSPAPLYDNVTRAAVAPGSTFKPLTAIAALDCGLNPYRTILDRGHIDIGDRSFGCYSWNHYRTTDGNQDLEWGMGHSCNYYFACIATGKDWGTGASLGYHKEITIDDIMDQAQKFGLGQATGIEIGETVAPRASVETKRENYREAVWTALYSGARRYFPAEVYEDYNRLCENINTIADWIYDNPSYSDLMDQMREKTDVKEEEIADCASMVKFDYFNMSTWTTFDAFNLCIGQGDNSYTPLQVANYIGTIGNHGKRNQVSLVYGVEGSGLKQKDAPYDTGLSEDHREAVLRGMKRVCLSGTLSSAFRNFPVSVAGKTGTAQYQAIKQPSDEVTYIKANLARINQAAGCEVTWGEVETTMQALMKSDANKYPTENDTVDQALIVASAYRVTGTMINANKDPYEDFAWVVAMAPAEDPEIVICMMLPEGGLAETAGQGVRDLMAAYFQEGSANSYKICPVYVPTEQNGENKMN